MTAEELIAALELEPHPEGGFFRRTFQADHRPPLQTEAGPRFTLTSIYYLLTREAPLGHWHCNRSDILHCYHLGGPLEYFLIHPGGELERAMLGPDIGAGQVPQLLVRGGSWKATRLAGGDYGLLSEAVAPGFDYADMHLGEREELLAAFPQHREWIDAFSLPVSGTR